MLTANFMTTVMQFFYEIQLLLLLLLLLLETD
jgi:hypothetical protein